jgi:hypothetical protein
MLQTLRFTVRRISRVLIPALLLMLAANDVTAQACTGNYPNPKGVRVPGVIPGTNGFYTGLIEYLPNDYLTQPTKEYPVIIYFPGFLGQGTGSMADLCNIITNEQSHLVNHAVGSHLIDRIERGDWGANIVPTVGATSFIVIAAQYTGYGNGDEFNFPNETDALIDYIVSQYRIDESRIYLTGMSTGSNMAMDYIASSAEHAGRIAAVAMPALCLPRDYVTAAGPANIAAGDVATWFVHCISEENPPNTNTNEVCEMSDVNDWVNAINAQSPTTAPRLTVLAAGPEPFGTTYPARYNWCEGFTHDAWRAGHAFNFAPTSGPGPDMYSWFLTFQQESALPIVLKSFTARLSNGKVYLRWVTSSEQDNAGFVIERASGNGSFSALTTVAGGGNTSGDRVYEYVDESPLSNLSFYRLKQLDAGGRNKYYDTRKVMNKPRFKSMIIVTPNPFTSDPSAFVNVDKKQKVTIWLTDMSGRTLSSVNGVYEEGTTELSLPTGSLPRGIYFLKVAGENITETHKIIKQ